MELLAGVDERPRVHRPVTTSRSAPPNVQAGTMTQRSWLPHYVMAQDGGYALVEVGDYMRCWAEDADIEIRAGEHVDARAVRGGCVCLVEGSFSKAVAEPGSRVFKI